MFTNQRTLAQAGTSCSYRGLPAHLLGKKKLKLCRENAGIRKQEVISNYENVKDKPRNQILRPKILET